MVNRSSKESEMTDAISKTISNETSISVIRITHLPTTLPGDLSISESSASREMKTAKKLYHEIAEGDKRRNEALNDWYWSWRRQIKIAQSTESALLALETALDLTIWLSSYSKDDFIFEAALEYMEEFKEKQLLAIEQRQPGLIEKLYPVDSTKKASILFRLYPPGSTRSGEVQTLWAELSKM